MATMKRRLIIIGAPLLILPAIAWAAASSTGSSSPTAPSSPAQQSTQNQVVPGAQLPSAATSTDILPLLLQLKGVSGGNGGASAAGSVGSASAAQSPSVPQASSPSAPTPSSASAATGGSYPDYVPLISVIPYARLSWPTAIPSDTEVYYSIVPPVNVDHSQSVAYEATTTAHAAILQNLLSDTTYYVLELSKTPEGRTVYARSLSITLP